jgi:hypothetical protein
MQIKASFTSNPSVRTKLMVAVDAGLTAGAKVQQRAVKAEFRANRNGYTTGDFATGEAATIDVDPPKRDENGVASAGAYTSATREGGTVSEFKAFNLEDGSGPFPEGAGTLPSGSAYPLFWEFGHQNRYLNKFVSAPVFQPALEASADTATRSFTRAFYQTLRNLGDTK